MSWQEQFDFLEQQRQLLARHAMADEFPFTVTLTVALAGTSMTVSAPIVLRGDGTWEWAET